MLGILIYGAIFFVLPVSLIAWWGISLSRFLRAKKQNKSVPGQVRDEEIRKRKIMLIVSSVTAGVLTAVVIGFLAMMYMAIAFM